jgi:hypothetical protein
MAFTTPAVWADGRAMLGIISPSALEANQADLSILHRFLGSVLDQPLETFFGISGGANVSMGFRYMIDWGLELNLSYDWTFAEIAGGASFRYRFPAIMLVTQADLQYFNFAQAAARAGGVFAALSAQTEPLFGRLSPMMSVGYDSYFNRVGFTAGLLVMIVPGFSAIAEVYPPFGIGGTFHAEELGGNPTLALGVRLDTYGHNFIFLISNNYQIGERRLMAGTVVGPSGSGLGGSGFLNALYLGFTIRRRFDF